MKTIVNNPLRPELQSAIRVVHNIKDEQSDELLIFDDSKSYHDFLDRIESLHLTARMITYRYANERPESAKDFSNYVVINLDVGRI